MKWEVDDFKKRSLNFSHHMNFGTEKGPQGITFTTIECVVE